MSATIGWMPDRRGWSVMQTTTSSWCCRATTSTMSLRASSPCSSAAKRCSMATTRQYQLSATC
jgi:hypothetical protein